MNDYANEHQDFDRPVSAEEDDMSKFTEDELAWLAKHLSLEEE